MAHKDQGRNEKGQFTSEEDEKPSIVWRIDADGDRKPDISARGVGAVGVIAALILGIAAVDLVFNNGEVTAIVIDWILSQI